MSEYLICEKPMNPNAAWEWELGSRAASALMLEDRLDADVVIAQRFGFHEMTPARELYERYFGRGIMCEAPDGDTEFYEVYDVDIDKDGNYYLCGEELWTGKKKPACWKVPVENVVEDFDIKFEEFEWGGET